MFATGRAPKRARFNGSQKVVTLSTARKLVLKGGESNFRDVATLTKANDTTGSIALVNGVAQGITVNTRNGKKYHMSSIQLRGIIRSNSATTVAGTANMLVYDKRPTGTLPVITDILDTISSESFNNDVNSSRFRVIRRWDDVLVQAQGAGPNSGKNFDYFVKLNLPVEMKTGSAGDAISDMSEGALYFITVGNQAAGTLAAATSVGFRLRFKDL